MEALTIKIGSLVRKCQAALMHGTPVLIPYNDRVALKNNELPQSIGIAPINIYALWVRESPDKDWVPMYIGQRSQEMGWDRVKQHLFHTREGTWSKIQHVKKIIEAGYEIGVTSILVEPDSMRLTIEDELIFRNTSSPTALPWNDKARNVPLPGSRCTPRQLELKRIRLEAIAAEEEAIAAEEEAIAAEEG